MTRTIAATAMCLILAACSQGQSAGSAAAAPDGNLALVQASASGAAATAAVTSAVAASSATPAQKDRMIALVKERHAGYGQIGKAMRSAKKAIDSGDLAGARTAAGTIDTLAPKTAGWFPIGSGNELVMPAGHKIEAKAEIWKQPEVFAADMKNFRQAAAAFRQAAAGTDIAAMKTAHANLGGTCKACHERFRAE